MEQPSPHLYRQQGRQLGVPEAVLTAAADRSSQIEQTGASPILSLRHLAHLTGAPYLYLREIVQRARDPYQTLSRPKRSGGSRPISAPEPMLMDVQRVILRRALRKLQHHPASYAYRQGRSILDCANQHLGARWMIKFDLHNFFGTINERDAYQVFLGRGYAPLVALELARLCTRSRPSDWWGTADPRYQVIPSYAVNVMGYLPQGGPTSGALANAVATPLDGALNHTATANGFVFTRYSDDFVFSSTDRFVRTRATHIVREVRKIVEAHHFRLHEKKTRVIPPGARHIVLGLLVADRVRLLPEFRRRIEVHVNGVTKFGLTSHAQHRGFRSVLSFISHVDGSLSFAKSIEPEWAYRTADSWTAALRANNYPVNIEVNF